MRYTAIYLADTQFPLTCVRPREHAEYAFDQPATHTDRHHGGGMHLATNLGICQNCQYRPPGFPNHLRPQQGPS